MIAWAAAALESASSLAAETWRNTPTPLKTIIIAAFGSFIGAWLSGRSQEKRRILEELKAIHAAYNLCFSIANRALALKQQQVLPMKQQHDEAVAAFERHRQQTHGPLLIQLDLKAISQLKFPGELLEKFVFEKCGVVGAKGLAAVVALTGAIAEQRHSITFRNELLSDFRAKSPAMTELERIQFYVGAAQAGQIDSRFPNNLKALSNQTDDCIFFSMILADELLQHGNRLHYRNRLKFRLGVPKLIPADWTIAREAGLLPDQADYVNWTVGFASRPTWWRQLVSSLKGTIQPVVTSTMRRTCAPDKSRTRPLSTLGGYRRRSKRPHSRYISKDD